MQPHAFAPPMFGFWVDIDPSDVMSSQVARQRGGVTNEAALEIMKSLDGHKLNQVFWPDSMHIDLVDFDTLSKEPARWDRAYAELEVQVAQIMTARPGLAGVAPAREQPNTKAPLPRP